MRTLFLAGMFALAAAGACSGASPEDDEVSPEVLAARARSSALRRCPLPPQASSLATAQACAEWFVARNGFLADTLKDTSAVARDQVERKMTMTDLLSSRHNAVARKATLVCNSGGRTAYTVAFIIPRDSLSDIGRTVTMDSAFARLRVERLPFKLRMAAADPNCHKV